MDRVSDPIKETTEAFKDAFSDVEPFMNFSQYPDPNSRDYLWGWYWFLSGYNDISLLVRVSKHINDYNLAALGLMDAEEYYSERT